MSKSTQNKRVTIEIDFASLSLDQLREVTNALARLQTLAERGVLRFEMSKIHASKKRPSPANKEPQPLQPQAEEVLAFLAANPSQEYTAGEIASGTAIKENSIRGQLHVLLKRSLVRKRERDSPPGSVGRKTINVWSAIDQDNVVKLKKSFGV